jgi:thioredoxin reductase (NADPH)
VQVLANSEVTALHGAEILESIAVTNRQSGGSQTYATRWLFVCIGGEPNTAWADEVGIIRDSAGYLVTDPDLEQDHRSLPVGRSIALHIIWRPICRAFSRLAMCGTDR